MERIDANTTVQSYYYQRTGSFYALSNTVVLGVGIQYGSSGNLPCHCYLYGFTFMSEYYNQDLTIISYLRKANRGTQIWYTTNLGASNSSLDIITATNYTTAWSTRTLLNLTSTSGNPPTAYICSGNAISSPATNVECHTFHVRFSLFVNTTVSADPQTIFSLNPSPLSSTSYFELIYNPSNDSLTINILMNDSTTVQTTTDSNLITKNELNELIIEFSKSGAKPPYNVSLYFRNVDQNIYNQYSNVTSGANVSDSFYLTSWCMVGCASIKSSAYTKQASNIIFSDIKLICGSNSGLLDSSSLDSSTISPSGTTANCEYGAITTAEHYYCLACTHGYYEDPIAGCQLSCSSSYYEMSTGTCAPLCPRTSVPTGSRYCYYGCMSACSSNCVSCTGNLCSTCTGCSDGYYLENTTYTCQPCNSTCQNCTSNLVCTICQPYFNLTNGKCDACNNGYYLTGDSCLRCNTTCISCNSLTYCTSCQTNFNLTNGKCDACNNGYYLTGDSCLRCNTTCTSCNSLTYCTSCQTNFNLTSGRCDNCNWGYYLSTGGTTCLPCGSNCVQCTSSTTCTQCSSGYNLTSGTNNSCVSCNLNGSYISGLQCLQCDNTCQTCNGSLATNCLTCPSRTYLLISNNSCVGACSSNGYYISGSDCLQCDSSCLTCNGAAPINCLSCPNSAYYLSSNQSCVASDAATVQAAEAVGTTSKVIFISATASAVLTYLPSKGNSPMLMRMLQIMARITFMKLIDINYLSPLAKFYDDTDLGQFGLPNVFNKITNASNTNDRRILTQLNSNGGDSSSNLFLLDVQGDVTFNRYFGYTFSQLFLDDYGGIVFSSCITFVLYLIVKLVSKCFKDENSKIRAFLTKLAQAFERSIIVTLLVSRYMYLCSSLIFNYVFHRLDGIYEKISFGFAVFYTILLIYIIGLALCAAFYYTRESKARLKPVRPLLNILRVLLKGYNRKRFIGRLFPFWTLLSDLMRVLVLLLLYKWRLVQLVFLIIMSLTTIALSLPKSVFKRNASRILMIGIEVGFIILYVLFFAMYFFQNSGSLTAYNFQLVLSWNAVIMNISLILFQIIIEIAEFFLLRRQKKRQEQQQKAIQNINQLENPRRLIEKSGNFNDTHNSQPIQISHPIHMPNVGEIESVARRPNKYGGVMVNTSRRTRRTVGIDDANNSQQVQLQNGHKRELSFEQPNR